MKYIRLVLSLSLVAFFATFSAASAATSYDSATATIQKATAGTAKVIIKKNTYTAPIKFTDGASWTTVKDHYEVSPVVVSGLEAHKISISINSDGKASFTKKKAKK
jgi:hypothetical protein